MPGTIEWTAIQRTSLQFHLIDSDFLRVPPAVPVGLAEITIGALVTNAQNI